MKQLKLFLGILILLYSSNSSKAQNWLTAGNTLFGTEIFGSNAGAFPLRIGTTPAQPIIFSTAGAPRMTILGQAGATQGFVGIGTATPLSNLSVDGAALATGEVFRTDCATGDSPFLRFLRGGSEFGTLWNTAVTIPFYAGGVANGQAYTPDDFIVDAPTGSFIVQGWSKDLTGTNVLKEIFRTTTGGIMKDYDLTPENVDGLRIQSQSKTAAFGEANIDIYTGPAGATQMKFDRSGMLTGRSNAFFVIAQRYGLVLTTAIAGSPNPTGWTGLQHIVMQINAVESMRVSPSRFVRIGDNTFNTTTPNLGVEAARRLEVVDQNNVPQLRLSHNFVDPAVANTGKFADVYSTASGDLAILATDLTTTTVANQPRFTGIQTITPQNTLEITSTGLSTDFGSANGSSGLRLTNLTSASTPYAANPGLGVLGVDANGDVIYVPGSSNTPPGGYCGTGAAGLSSDFEIPLNNFNYYFTDPAGPLNDGLNFVKIGDACTAPLSSKLQVHRGLTTNAQFQVSGSYALNDDLAQSTVISGYGFGASGEATGNNRVNGGVYGTSSGATTNAGGYFEARASYVSATVNDDNYGVEAFAQNARRNVGIFAQADGSTANRNTGGNFKGINALNNNVGVVAECNGSANVNIAGQFNITAGANTNVGIYAQVPGTGSIEYAAYLLGDMFLNGMLGGTNNIMTISDSTFKTNVDSITNALAIIKQLKPKQYYLDTLNTDGFRFPAEKQYGLISQQVERVLPELVSSVTKPADYDSLDNVIHPAITFKALNYNAFISILMKGMQEQQSTIDSLKEENSVQDSINASLQQQIDHIVTNLNECCNNRSQQINPEGSSSLDIDLKDGQSIVLEQNVPNPFAEQTTIHYFLPDDVSKAQMLFYNAQGRLIQSTELTQKGKGQLNVFANDLTNGIYTYTLVVNGKVIETKKMVKQ